MTQQMTIAEFIRVFNEATGAEYRVTDHPDESNRSSRDIDAVAESEGVPLLAIEHTLVQTMSSQKLDDARFQQVFVPITKELADEMPPDLEVILNHGALQPRTDWAAIAESMKAWLRANVAAFAIGFKEHRVPGVPFGVSVLRPKDGIGLPFQIMRMATPDELRPQTIECVRAALASKDDQLQKYSDSGATTVLLLESQDWVLVDALDIHAAYLAARAAVRAPHIHQVWFARIHEPGGQYGVLCFDGPQAIMDAVNPANLEWRSS